MRGRGGEGAREARTRRPRPRSPRSAEGRGRGRGERGERRKARWGRAHLSLGPRLSRFSLQAQGSAVTRWGGRGHLLLPLKPAPPATGSPYRLFLLGGRPPLGRPAKEEPRIRAALEPSRTPPPCAPPPDPRDVSNPGKGRRWCSPLRRGARSSLGSPGESGGVEDLVSSPLPGGQGPRGPSTPAPSHTPLCSSTSPLRTPWDPQRVILLRRFGSSVRICAPSPPPHPHGPTASFSGVFRRHL